MNTLKKRDINIKKIEQLEILKNENNFVTLEMMLNAREKRVQRQEHMLKDGICLVCFTMNIPGPYKTSPLIRQAFFEGADNILNLFKTYNINILNKTVYNEVTGPEMYISVNYDPVKIKQFTVQTEEYFPLGRLFDIDVLKHDGTKISRKDVGLSERKCMICGKDGAYCARSRAHTVDELQNFAVSLMCDYFADKYGDFAASQAVRALMYEVSVTPKPGLVDRMDSGSHKDMNFYTFIDSTASLYEYFKKCTLKGIEMSGLSLDKLYGCLKYLGVHAENKMFSATAGVNTHKGAVFSFGLACGALGYLKGKGDKCTCDNILNTVSCMAQQSFDDLKAENGYKSFGKEAFKKYGVKGVRGQAAEGYPLVKMILPVIRDMFKDIEDIDCIGCTALVYLMKELDDTNIIKRSDINNLKQVKETAKNILSSNNDIKQCLYELNEQFKQKNISPGGCADLLALSFFIYFICE